MAVEEDSRSHKPAQDGDAGRQLVYEVEVGREKVGREVGHEEELEGEVELSEYGKDDVEFAIDGGGESIAEHSDVECAWGLCLECGCGCQQREGFVLRRADCSPRQIQMMPVTLALPTIPRLLEAPLLVPVTGVDSRLVPEILKAHGSIDYQPFCSAWGVGR